MILHEYATHRILECDTHGRIQGWYILDGPTGMLALYKSWMCDGEMVSWQPWAMERVPARICHRGKHSTVDVWRYTHGTPSNVRWYRVEEIKR